MLIVDPIPRVQARLEAHFYFDYRHDDFLARSLQYKFNLERTRLDLIVLGPSPPDQIVDVIGMRTLIYRLLLRSFLT